MSEERRGSTEDPGPAPSGWSERLRAELVAAAQRQLDAARPARRRLLCRHRQ